MRKTQGRKFQERGTLDERLITFTEQSENLERVPRRGLTVCASCPKPAGGRFQKGPETCPAPRWAEGFGGRWLAPAEPVMRAWPLVGGSDHHGPERTGSEVKPQGDVITEPQQRKRAHPAGSAGPRPLLRRQCSQPSTFSGIVFQTVFMIRLVFHSWGLTSFMVCRRLSLSGVWDDFRPSSLSRSGPPSDCKGATCDPKGRAGDAGGGAGPCLPCLSLPCVSQGPPGRPTQRPSGRKHRVPVQREGLASLPSNHSLPK